MLKLEELLRATDLQWEEKLSLAIADEARQWWEKLVQKYQAVKRNPENMHATGADCWALTAGAALISWCIEEETELLNSVKEQLHENAQLGRQNAALPWPRVFS